TALRMAGRSNAVPGASRHQRVSGTRNAPSIPAVACLTGDGSLSCEEEQLAARTVRYAVVGLGHIAQAAVIPAFAHAHRNSKLVALVSGDRTKRREIAGRYQI